MKKAGFLFFVLVLIMTMISCGGSDDGDNLSEATASDYCKSMISKSNECESELQAYIEEKYGSGSILQIASQSECEANVANYDLSDSEISTFINTIKYVDCDQFVELVGPGIGVTTGKLKEETTPAGISGACLSTE